MPNHQTMSEKSPKKNLGAESDIVNLILEDHKPLKRLIKIMKDSDKHSLAERSEAFAEFAPLLVALRKVDAQYKSNGIFQSATCALHEYRARHERAGYDLDYMRRLFPDDLWEEIGQAQGHAGGVLHREALRRRAYRRIEAPGLQDH